MLNFTFIRNIKESLKMEYEASGAFVESQMDVISKRGEVNLLLVYIHIL